MVNIAFKRAKHSPMVKESLHPEFITEFADVTQFPEGFHKVEDGYEILSKDQFELEYAKNQQLMDEFKVKKLKKQQYIAKLEEDKKRREAAKVKAQTRKEKKQ